MSCGLKLFSLFFLLKWIIQLKLLASRGAGRMADKWTDNVRMKRRGMVRKWVLERETQKAAEKPPDRC